jgi:hypothetical protein
MAYLEIRKDKALLQSTLDDDAMSLGRLPGNSIVINDPDISRRHCVIERWEGKYSIYDLGSRNGTKINGKRTQRTELKSGDVITIGSTVIKFVDDATIGAPARTRPIYRSVAWGAAIVVLLLGAFLAAWATGLLGKSFEPSELKHRLGIDTQATNGQATERNQPIDVGNSSGASRIERQRDTDALDASPLLPLPQPGDLEPEAWRKRYAPLTSETAALQRGQLIGHPVTADFIGKPVLDERGEVLWELPPDGSVTAVLQPADAEAQRTLTVLMAEPLLLEVELAGLLEEDLTRGRMLLRVGVINVRHAWGSSDDSLQPATRRLLNQRLVLDPEYTSQAIESRRR